MSTLRYTAPLTTCPELCNLLSKGGYSGGGTDDA